MLLAQHLSFSKTLNPPFLLPPTTPPPNKPNSPSFFRHNSLQIRALAGRSKKNSPEGGGGGGRIEGIAELHHRLKRNVRQKAKKLAESFFYRLKNPNKNYADNLTEDELNMIGLGYDRMVRFMDKDDPNLKHPYDWYKYGEFGPYSWRGVVLGDPIVGRFTDERVTMYSEVKNQEEWEKIEQFEMEVDFGERLKKLDKSVGFKHYWVFVRHPKWRLSEQPWEQWTLVSEVVVQAGKKERIDKWNLMGRLGNTTRKLITQCAAWFRPDIIYVKRPVYQCRFEPQMDFFKGLTPLLDPQTERDFMCELRNEDDGSVEMCTYYEGLCKIVKVSKKAFVDDVVNAYEKLSDEKKSKCLEFLLNNHPVLLLHPYTKEWKAKLEEAELGCDAPDEDDEYNKNDKEFDEWIEEDSQGDDDDKDDVVADMEDEGDDDEIESEDEKFWDEKLKKEMSVAEEMENLARWSVKTSSEFYKRQLSRTEAEEKGKAEEDGDESALRGVRGKVEPEEWKIAGIGKWRKRVKKSRIPPELFLRAAVKPFTYRNLVKEIVLIRHAILDGDIGTTN